MRQERDELGETLIEVLCSIILIGAIVAAYFTVYSSAASASTSTKNLATADTILRSYAEDVKAAVRNGCTAGAALSVAYPPIGQPALPTGFVASLSNSPTCPSTTQVQKVAITVTMPNGATRELDIDVRAA